MARSVFVMSDHVSLAGRRNIMRAIRSRDTKPELAVRKLLHASGYRYRLHDSRLPGCPDIVFPSRRKVVFVHGCFWHSHCDASCTNGRKPATNQAYWLPKLSRNVTRDAKHLSRLRAVGWQVMIIWECETKDGDYLAARIRAFLGSPRRLRPVGETAT